MKRNTLCFLGILLFFACQDKGRVVTPKRGPAKLVMLETEYNFGALTDDDQIVEHDFRFVNEGSEKLVISKVQAHCHCTAVDYPKEPIKPGHGNKLKVYLNVRDLSPGYFTRTIEVYPSGNTDKQTIFIKGEKL